MRVRERARERAASYTSVCVYILLATVCMPVAKLKKLEVTKGGWNKPKVMHSG
jgi:hypothetical protein